MQLHLCRLRAQSWVWCRILHSQLISDIETWKVTSALQQNIFMGYSCNYVNKIKWCNIRVGFIEKPLCAIKRQWQELVCFPQGKCLQKSIVKYAADGLLVDSMYLSPRPDFREGLFSKKLRFIFSCKQCSSASPKVCLFVCPSPRVEIWGSLKFPKVSQGFPRFPTCLLIAG